MKVIGMFPVVMVRVLRFSYSFDKQNVHLRKSPKYTTTVKEWSGCLGSLAAAHHTCVIPGTEYAQASIWTSVPTLEYDGDGE